MKTETKNLNHTQSSFVQVEHPVRDEILVKNGYSREHWRAVRHAIYQATLRPYGTFIAGVASFFYQYCVPNGTLTTQRCNLPMRNQNFKL